MALPQDGQDANGLTKVTQIPAGKELMFIDPTTNEGGIITLEDLTKQILNGLTSQTFGLDSGTQTLPAAINYLYGKTNIISYPIRSKLDFITVSGNFLCIGNIVIYHFTIKSTKDWSGQSVPIFRDVPVPIVNDTCLSGMAYTGNGVYKTSFRLYSGILYLNESLSANVPYIVTGSYIKNN